MLEQNKRVEMLELLEFVEKLNTERERESENKIQGKTDDLSQ